jgi:predicted ATP-dependent protease
MTQATAAAFLSLLARFTKCLFRPDCAVTAELSLSGLLLPVGSVQAKLRGAKENDVKRVVVSRANYACLPDTWKNDRDMEVLKADTAFELIGLCRDQGQGELKTPISAFSGVCYLVCQDTREREAMYFSSVYSYVVLMQ